MMKCQKIWSTKHDCIKTFLVSIRRLLQVSQLSQKRRIISEYAAFFYRFLLTSDEFTAMKHSFTYLVTFLTTLLSLIRVKITLDPESYLYILTLQQTSLSLAADLENLQ